MGCVHVHVMRLSYFCTLNPSLIHVHIQTPRIDDGLTLCESNPCIVTVAPTIAPVLMDWHLPPYYLWSYECSMYSLRLYSCISYSAHSVSCDVADTECISTIRLIIFVSLCPHCGSKHLLDLVWHMMYMYTTQDKATHNGEELTSVCRSSALLFP